MALWSGGSSPLARGARDVDVGEDPEPGLIPARAGSTSSSGTPGGGESAHPRSRGEHTADDTTSSMQRGSSPLARGALIARDVNRFYRGSSPLARGAPGACRCGGRGRRLIPARAGSTSPSGPASTTSAAHPRSRGEHRRWTACRRSLTGSSPLARGALRQGPPRPCLGRLIPARAGSTPTRSARTRSRAAHPRSRGEHPSSPAPKVATPGSSPLARGAL